ncbi:BTAD domain-containing putative transcriptional regulator [Streptomyces phaeochromogenes]|uniref:AfsR/SARP family transcriptional regulator n=1 Tax=Streptomyces phaeochromogenes TaxID=1923 RepID=UPI0033ED10B5
MSSSRSHFRLLGPLEAEVDSRPVRLTGRQRALCAALLLNANHVVSVDRVIHYVWNEHLPQAAAARVRALVAEIRRALGPAGAHLLRTQSPGYLMSATADELDLLEFEAQIKDGSAAAARGDWEKACACHERALTLWRGDPLPDLSAAAEREHLRELHLTALEGRAEAEIALGRHRGAVAELVQLTAAHPLREHPHALLMQALQLDGRTSEALQVYARLRGRTIDELGIEPSAETNVIHQRLLAGETAAHRPTRSAIRTKQPRIPRQLPPATGRFVGREEELGVLDDCRRNAAPIALIVGPAGVGKTALGLQWAHRTADAFPDGQLFLDMRGFDDADPMTPQEAVPLLLQGLGCGPRDIPVGLDAQTALYRTLLADRRALVFLDDVADPSYARQLLPGTGGALTLVTSRAKLSGLVTLDGAYRLTCGVLKSSEALELISEAAGREVVAADPAAAARLAELCDHLPLALCVAGSWLGDRRPDSIRSYVSELADRGRLARLHVEGEDNVAVRAALDLSYGTLPADTRRAFRSLGLTPGTGRSTSAAAACANLDVARMGDLLRVAARVHLLQEVEGGRFTWHDLVHEYAGQRALAEDGPLERHAAIERLLHHYLGGIGNVAKTCGLYVSQHRIEAVEGASPREFSNSEDAYAWFDSEWDDIAAAVSHAAERGPLHYAWRLVDALQDLLHHRRPMSAWIRLAELVRSAAEGGGDRIGQATMSLSLGHARWRLGDLTGALDEYESAQNLARSSGWQHGEAASLQGIGVTVKMLGAPERALPHYRRSIAIYRDLGNSRGEAVILINMASAAHVLGRLAEAESALLSALPLVSSAGQPLKHLHAMALVNLGLVLQKQAKLREAMAALRESFGISQDSGSAYAEAVTLEALGRVHRDAGRDERAILAYEDALTVARRAENRNCQVDSLVGLASVELSRNHVDEAIRHLTAAREILDETGHSAGLVEMLLAQAAVDHALGDMDAALRHLDQGAQLAAASSPLTLPRIHVLSAVILMGAGEFAKAFEAASDAIDRADSSGQQLLQARASMVLAAIHEARGEIPAAQARRREARTLFADIGTPEHHQAAIPSSPSAKGPRGEYGSRARNRRLPNDAESRLALYLAEHFTV